MMAEVSVGNIACIFYSAGTQLTKLKTKYSQKGEVK